MKEIPFSEIARLPLPGAAVPIQMAFGPADRALSYLYSPDGSLERRLFVLDLEAARGELPGPREIVVGGPALSEDELSLEEQLRRERAREVGLGVTSAVWAEEADVLLVPLADGLHLISGLSADGGSGLARLVLPSASGEIVAPRLSPDGTKIAFVRAGDLYVVDASGSQAPRQLTSSATTGVTCAVAEFIAQEEMGRSAGLWWAPDSRSIAYTEVDERHIPLYRIVHQGSEETGPAAEEEHRYPFAGKANAVVRLGVVTLDDGETVWMDTGEEDQYLARAHWLTDGRLVAEIESRDQTRLDVVALDPMSGEATLLHSETSDIYINLHDDFRALTSGEWLWSSERSGFRHLEVRSASGELVRVLTSGQWQVDKLEGLDEERGVVYFTATKDGPTERHLYSVPLAGGEIRRITPEPGTHQVVVAKRRPVFCDRHGSLDSPPVVRLRSLEDGSTLATLHDKRDPRIDELGLQPPAIVSFPAEDGSPLYALVYRPEGDKAAGAPPLAVYVYGGPHAQLVVNDWAATTYLRAQALARLGFTVLVTDNRGSARRGLEFESHVWHQMGLPEVEDQVRAVRWAVENGLADPERVGIYGWSYGGYMTLRCLALAPETFRAGVAGAPVTDWDGYDTHYTERYMGHPSRYRAEYGASSVLECAGEIAGKLLIVHGLIDENVHFRHSARLISRLVAACKPYDLLCFPAERHLPRRQEDRAFMEQQVIGWLLEALAPPT